MSAYEIGVFYDVPCVHGKVYEMLRWWPVLGGFHEDSEHIGFDDWHWHLDARFVAASDLKRLQPSNFANATDAARRYPLMLAPESKGYWSGAVKFTPEAHPTPVLKRRLCKRQWADTTLVDRATWIGSLEAAHASKVLAKGHCPHRGADLTTFPIDKHGCVECPLHGLRWHVETGRLVPRAEYREMERRSAA